MAIYNDRAAEAHICLPQLLVDDVVGAATFYRDQLGFQVGPFASHQGTDEPPIFVIVRRDGVQIHLRIVALVITTSSECSRVAVGD